MALNRLHDRAAARRARKRVGRGTGSGTGKTSGRGHKGAKARSGTRIGGFEGGQMPIYRRMPKRGFRNPSARVWTEVTLGRLQRAVDAGRLDAGAPVTVAQLRAAGLFKKERDGVRLIQGGGNLKVGLHITVAGASAPAKAAIEALGGSVTVSATRSFSEHMQEDAPSGPSAAAGSASASEA